MLINTHLQQLKSNYLFTEIANRTQAYQQAHPQVQVLRLGIGDVTLPLPQAISEAMHRAVDEMTHAETFRGYGPEAGYRWLRQAIIDHDYSPRGIRLTPEEIFISDGAGSDLGNLSELFDEANTVAIMEPSYPAYVDTSCMAGREIIWLPCMEQNDFHPALPFQKADIIYLCFPNNPTGTVLTRDELKTWVNYARANGSIILFDAAYEAFVDHPEIPRSIYEIEGAQEVAIEIRSYSKTAGFTALRCGYTVVPKATGLQTMWLRRQCTKFNGASYISQRAALATYSHEGQKGIHANLSCYKQTARILSEGLRNLGYEVWGGKNAPYIWCKTPDKMGSWDFFDSLLQRCQVVCTPGAGFGPSGEGYIRFSAFSKRDEVEEALQRMKKI